MFGLMRLTSFVIAVSLSFTLSVDAQDSAISSRRELTNAKDARAVVLDAEYQAFVAELPADQQQLENFFLQEDPGGFYLPIHKCQKVAGQSNA